MKAPRVRGLGLLAAAWFFELLTMDGSRIARSEIRGPYLDMGACAEAARGEVHRRLGTVFNAAECFADDVLEGWRGANGLPGGQIRPDPRGGGHP